MSECLSVFGRDNVRLLSNSVGIESEDHGLKNAKLWESQNDGISVIRHHEKKPDCGREVLSHFPNLQPSEIVVIGDRLLTDVLMANENGMMSILTVQLLDLSTDNTVAAAMRLLERKFLLKP